MKMSSLKPRQLGNLILRDYNAAKNEGQKHIKKKKIYRRWERRNPSGTE